MNEIGRVLKIEGRTITVKGGELDGCVGCMNDTCKTSGRLFAADNKSGLPLSVGQLVEVVSSRAATAGQAVFVFLPPLAAFVAAYVAVAKIAPSADQPVRAAAGVVGLFAGFFAVFAIRKIWPSKNLPRIDRLVAEEELESGAAADLGGAEPVSP